MVVVISCLSDASSPEGLQGKPGKPGRSRAYNLPENPGLSPSQSCKPIPPPYKLCSFAPPGEPDPEKPMLEIRLLKKAGDPSSSRLVGKQDIQNLVGKSYWDIRDRLLNKTETLKPGEPGPPGYAFS